MSPAELEERKRTMAKAARAKAKAKARREKVPHRTAPRHDMIVL